MEAHGQWGGGGFFTSPHPQLYLAFDLDQVAPVALEPWGLIQGLREEMGVRFQHPHCSDEVLGHYPFPTPGNISLSKRTLTTLLCILKSFKSQCLSPPPGSPPDCLGCVPLTLRVPSGL